MVPSAPGRFSTIIGWPSRRSMPLAYVLATMSGVEAGAFPITRRTGLAGHDCASAGTATTTAMKTTDARSMLVLLLGRLWGIVQSCGTAGATMLTERWETSPRQHDITVERDVRVAIRGGMTLAADVFRPAGPGKF